MGERSGSGDPILRHGARERPFEPTGGDADLLGAIDDHLGRCFPGADVTVFHEIVSDLVHVDVHLVPPAGDRAWNTLVTSGMAQRPMAAPEELSDARWAELVLALPPDWPLSQEMFEDERNYWPVRLLKQLARLPHEYDTWLWFGHSIPNGDPAEPYAPGTGLAGAVLLSPVLTPDEFDELRLDDDRTIHFLAPIPVHAEEMRFKLDHGADALAGLLGSNGVTELVDPARPSFAPRRKRFGLF